tara:strand:- start:1022 stop:1564 length:543 start_codon:yes stop_codon:yes gene_type:complete
MIKITDYIKLYENVLDKEICQNIIKDSNFNEFKRATVNNAGVDAVDITSRNVHNKPLENKYENSVFNSVADILLRYRDDIPDFFTGSQCHDTGYSHLLYRGSEGGKYKTHTDSFKKEPRLISISILLNDNFDGGNFCFFDEHILEKKVGSAVVFPSNFCFPHGVLPVTNGDRHSVITWMR